MALFKRVGATAVDGLASIYCSGGFYDDSIPMEYSATQSYDFVNQVICNVLCQDQPINHISLSHPAVTSLEASL